MKRYKNFLLRLLNLLLIVCALYRYQTIALIRAEAVAQRQEEIEEVQNYNAMLLKAQQTEEETEPEIEPKNGPRDGTYEGSAYGFGDLITVALTLKDGKITDIVILSAEGEDKPYYNQSLSVLDQIIAVQSTEVDTVSGATLTAEGMINAAADALGKAVS